MSENGSTSWSGKRQVADGGVSSKDELWPCGNRDSRSPSITQRVAKVAGRADTGRPRPRTSVTAPVSLILQVSGTYLQGSGV